MNIRILKKSFGGEFVPERPVLRLGGKGSAQVETLVFELPQEWQGKAVTIHVQHLDGTLPSPILLDGENSAVVDKTFTASAKGLWMLKAVDTDGYCALTRPSKYECYETFSTEGEEEITPSMYEAFVAQVAENARQAKAAAKQAQQSVSEIGDVLENAEGFAQAAEESATAAKSSEENAAASAQQAKSDAETAKAAADKATAANATDKTLSIEDVPADAKTVGDALGDRYTKSEVYTKDEVERQIGNARVETDTTLTVSGAAADAAVTGDAVTALNAEIKAIKLRVTTYVTKNPFTVTFDTLSDVTATGVWNTSNSRIEF